jgi:hypothetical protein
MPIGDWRGSELRALSGGSGLVESKPVAYTLLFWFLHGCSSKYSCKLSSANFILRAKLPDSINLGDHPLIISSHFANLPHWA